MQTNTAAVPQASRQHGFVDGTQLVAMISSCSLLANLFNGLSLENCMPGHQRALQLGMQCSEVLQMDINLSTEGKPVLFGLCCPAFGKQFFRKHQAFILWKPANAEMSQIGQPREQLILLGFISHVFFSSWEILIEEREL